MADGKGSIGFIGLGLMGQAFTRRLVACGYRVTGYDVVADKLSAAAGARRASRRARPPRSPGRAIRCTSA